MHRSQRRRLSLARSTLFAVDVQDRAVIRRRVSDARRRLTGAELNAAGMTDMQFSSMKNSSLPVVAWEACDGDLLLALGYALDVLKTKAEQAA